MQTSHHRTSKSYDIDHSKKSGLIYEAIGFNQLTSSKIQKASSALPNQRFKSELSYRPPLQIPKTVFSGQKQNYLHNTLWYREIFVIKDGISSKQELFEGFKHKFCCFGNIRKNQKEELNYFFETCNKKWKPKNKIISLFTIDGKILKSLAEIDPQTKIAVAGSDFRFIGFHTLQLTKKEILEMIEESFIIKDSETFITSPRKKGVIYKDNSNAQIKSFLLNLRKKS